MRVAPRVLVLRLLLLINIATLSAFPRKVQETKPHAIVRSPGKNLLENLRDEDHTHRFTSAASQGLGRIQSRGVETSHDCLHSLPNTGSFQVPEDQHLAKRGLSLNRASLLESRRSTSIDERTPWLPEEIPTDRAVCGSSDEGSRPWRHRICVPKKKFKQRSRERGYNSNEEKNEHPASLRAHRFHMANHRSEFRGSSYTDEYWRHNPRYRKKRAHGYRRFHPHSAEYAGDNHISGYARNPYSNVNHRSSPPSQHDSGNLPSQPIHPVQYIFSRKDLVNLLQKHHQDLGRDMDNPYIRTSLSDPSK